MAGVWQQQSLINIQAMSRVLGCQQTGYSLLCTYRRHLNNCLDPEGPCFAAQQYKQDLTDSQARFTTLTSCSHYTQCAGPVRVLHSGIAAFVAVLQFWCENALSSQNHSKASTL